MQIPKFEPSVSFDAPSAPGVQGVNPSAFGETGAAVAQLGVAATQLGQQLMQKSKDAEDMDYANTRSQQFARDLDKKQLELKTQLPADYKGYTDQLNQWINDRYTQDQKEAPSNTAKRLYQGKAAESFQPALINANREEFQARVTSYQTNTLDSIKQNSDTLVSYPDTSKAYTQMDALDKGIQGSIGSIFNEAVAHEIIKKNREDTAKSLMDGYYAKAIGDPKGSWRTSAAAAVQVLNGTDLASLKRPSGSRVADYLSPSDKAAMMDKFERLSETRKTSDTTELHRATNDAFGQALVGQKINRTLFVPGGQWDQHVADGSETPAAKARAQQELVVADMTGNIRKELIVTSPDKWDGIIAGFERRGLGAISDEARKDPSIINAVEPGFGRTVVDQYKAKLIASKDELLRLRKEDPAAFTRSAFSGVDADIKAAGFDPTRNDAAISQLKAMQTALGIPSYEQKITTKDERAQIWDGIRGANGQQVSNFMSTQQQKYGSHWQDVFNEVNQDHPGAKDLWIANLLPDAYTRQQAVNTVINKSATDEAFRKKYAIETDKQEQALTVKVNESVKDYLRAVRNTSDEGGTLAVSNALNNAVLLRAKEELTSGINKTDDMDEAVTRASNILKSNFRVIDAANSTVMAPTYVNVLGRPTPVNPNQLKAFMEGRLTDDGIKLLNLRTPTPAGSTTTTEAQRREALIQQIKLTGQWVSSPNFDGLMLVKTDQFGRVSPVITNDGTANGRPLFIPFSHIAGATDMVTKKIMEKNKGTGIIDQMLKLAPEMVGPEK
jgi:hypothetical protein